MESETKVCITIYVFQQKLNSSLRANSSVQKDVKNKYDVKKTMYIFYI